MLRKIYADRRKENLKERGLTLIELLITMMTMSMLMGTVVLMFIVGQRTWHAGYARTNIRQDISQAMHRMVKEIRQAKDSTVVVAVDQIDFSADLDSSLGGDEDYRYRMVSNELRWSRTSPNPTSETVLSRNLELANSSFSESSNLITVQLQAALDEQVVTLRNKIRLRNI